MYYQQEFFNRIDPKRPSLSIDSMHIGEHYEMDE